MEVGAAGRQVAEYPVEDESVEVDVQVEAAAEALDDGEGAGVAIREAALAGLAAVEVQEYPNVRCRAHRGRGGGPTRGDSAASGAG